MIRRGIEARRHMLRHPGVEQSQGLRLLFRFAFLRSFFRPIVANMHLGILLRRAIPLNELTVFYGRLPLLLVKPTSDISDDDGTEIRPMWGRIATLSTRSSYMHTPSHLNFLNNEIDNSNKLRYRLLWCQYRYGTVCDFLDCCARRDK